MRTKLIRLFVSSTFSDFTKERELLNREIFPVIADHCKSQGFTFQPVDLRYGISAAAGEDNSTMAICLEEVARCQKTGHYPNFMLLVGNRCGWTPVPSHIEKEVFEQALRSYGENEENAPKIQYLSHWYRLDENQLPASYILLPKKQGWEIDETILYSIFMEMLSLNLFTEEQRENYFFSATGQEILHGLLKVENPAALRHILCISRELASLRGLDCYVDYENSKKDHLDNLKAKIEETCQKKNVGYVEHYTLADDSAWESYMTEFKDYVTKSLLAIVDESMNEYRRTHTGSEKEIHEEYLESHIDSIEGREDMAQVCEEYLSSPNQNALCFYGKRGAGKTSLMLAAMKRIIDLPEFYAIYRFVGISPQSSESFCLVQNLIAEICETYALAIPVFHSYSEAIGRLSDILQCIPKDKNLVICIDAIDQLISFTNENELLWLSKELPDNVWMIVSTRDGDYLRKVIGVAPFVRAIEIPPLSEEYVPSIMKKLLALRNRTLTEDQLQVVKEAYQKEKLPIYLKVIVSKLSSWTSDRSVEACKAELSSNVQTELLDFLSLLREDKRHGTMLVDFTFGFMLAARFGITENDLLYLLCRNEPVKQDYARLYPQSPQLEEGKALPFMLWSRLYYDVSDFIKTIIYRGNEMIDFYHLGIRDLIQADLENGYNNLLHCRKDMVSYYVNQPDFLDDAETIVNERKMSELGFQYQMLQDKKALCQLLERPTYVKAKLMLDSLYELIGEVFYAATDSCLDTEPMFRNVFTELVRFLCHEGFLHTYLEDVHNLLIFREDHSVHERFFQIANQPEVIYEALQEEALPVSMDIRQETNRILLQCQLKNLNRTRRYGDLSGAIQSAEKAEALLKEIISIDERDADYQEYARLMYDISYVYFYSERPKEAFLAMQKSIENAKKIHNELSAAMSETEYHHLRFYQAAGTPAEKEVLLAQLAYLDQAEQIFLLHSSNNLSAKRWMLNAFSHKIITSFILDDSEAVISSYKKFVGNQKEIYNASSNQKVEAVYLGAKGNYSEAIQRMVTMIHELERKSEVKDIDFHSMNYYLLMLLYERSGDMKKAAECRGVIQSLPRDRGNWCFRSPEAH